MAFSQKDEEIIRLTITRDMANAQLIKAREVAAENMKPLMIAAQQATINLNNKLQE